MTSTSQATAASAAVPWALLRPTVVIAAAVAVVSIVGFGVVAALQVPVLSDPSHVVDHAGLPAALAGIGLLVGDVLLPVPSSLVMVAHGALFGAVLGTTISIIGSVGAAAAGAGIGRGGRRWAEHGVDDDRRGGDLVRRWGVLAVVVSRPIPVLAESVAVAAGAAGMPWSWLLLASAIGALPQAVLYALAGAVAASFHNTALLFVLVAAVSAVVWLAWGRRQRAPV